MLLASSNRAIAGPTVRSMLTWTPRGEGANTAVITTPQTHTLGSARPAEKSARSLNGVTPGLPLTGERTVPGIAREQYWFARHEVVYRWLAARCAGASVLEAGSGEGYGRRSCMRPARGSSPSTTTRPRSPTVPPPTHCPTYEPIWPRCRSTGWMPWSACR